MKIVITSLILALSLQAKSVEWNIKQFKSFSNNQKAEIYKSYLEGVKYDLGHSFVGISWKESLGNKVDVNLQDPSCGKFHNSIKSVLSRHPEIKDTGFNRNILCVELQKNREFAIKETVSELLYWKKVHKSNWRKIYGSYNGGHTGNPKYADDIINKIKAFKLIVKDKTW